MAYFREKMNQLGGKQKKGKNQRIRAFNLFILLQLPIRKGKFYGEVMKITFLMKLTL